MTAGTLDRTFGLLGMTGADFGGADAAANAIAIQSDGKVLAAGYSRLGGSSALAVARFHPNGFLDPTFGGGPGLSPGELRIPLARGPSEVLAMALQSDGKIVLAGDITTSTAGDTIMTVARLLPDGRLDPGFGIRGVVLFESLPDSRAQAVIVVHDGRIIVAGPSHRDRLLYITLAALRSDGTPDTTFGTRGVVLTAPGIPSSLFGPVAFGAVDQDLGFVVVGRAIFSTGTTETLQPVALRYRRDGSLDDSFGDHGIVTIPGLAAQFLAVAVSANRNILAAGNLSTTPPQFLFSVLEARTGRLMLPHGPVITTSFADLGYPAALCQACFVHYDRQTERWLLAGTVTAGAKHNIALARYQYDGSLDPSFAGGRVVTSFLTGPSEGAAMAVQPADRKIIVAGNAEYAGAKMFALVRYLGI